MMLNNDGRLNFTISASNLPGSIYPCFKITGLSWESATLVCERPKDISVGTRDPDGAPNVSSRCSTLSIPGLFFVFKAFCSQARDRRISPVVERSSGMLMTRESSQDHFSMNPWASRQLLRPSCMTVQFTSISCVFHIRYHY